MFLFLKRYLNSIKYLGLYYDDKLKWCIRVNYLTKVIRKFFYIFKDVRYICYIQLKRIGILYIIICTVNINVWN
ncbi:Uncharacterized protein FWK35_00006627 [Aphis craccivora]|uniref:Uncharacterized protein n=1 Tax=Aphis craccivora TaxID=307492 RepID=A0A6G0ZQ01_APHCR|nr:Uncharacterized protein FWK35_00006627 [Aphis craccivora]